MTLKLVVLYPAPDDPQAFESYYAATHGPLVDALPGLLRWEAALALPGPDGSAPPFYRTAELWFESPEAMAASMGSPAGKALGQDMPNFAPPDVITFVAAVDA